jgi:hypothetical protein
LPVHAFISFCCHIYVSKSNVFAVDHLTDALRILSDSRRSTLVINAHCPIDHAGGKYCSICIRVEAVDTTCTTLMDENYYDRSFIICQMGKRQIMFVYN